MIVTEDVRGASVVDLYCELLWTWCTISIVWNFGCRLCPYVVEACAVSVSSVARGSPRNS